MISIRKFLTATEAENPWHRVVVTLLEGISEHSVVGDPAEHKRFQADVERMLEDLTATTDSSQLLVIAGRAVNALEGHNSRTAALIEEQSTELRTIVEMLARTIRAISAANGRSGTRLVEIQHELRETSRIDDVRVLRSKISECLKGIEDEVVELNKETGVTLDSLRKQVQDSTTLLARTGADSLTRLPGRAQAEQAIVEACRTSVQTYAVLYIVDRAALINDRFGRAVGDQAMRVFQEIITRDIRSEDRFFRWSPPAFFALLQREESSEGVRRALARTISHKFELTIETETRNLMLPLSCHWAVFPMCAAPQILIGKLEAFAAAHTQGVS